MAPQNSTLLHENIESTSELLGRYSPILPIEEQGNEVHRKKSICSNAISIQYQDDELPIWICGKPRFILGTTNQTTCNEIIQALIEDEIPNEDIRLDVEYNNYVITENWRNVEQVLTGETQILAIWKAWGNSKCEIKFKLKINKNKDSHHISSNVLTGMNHDYNKDNNLEKCNNSKTKIILKLIRRLLKQGEDIQNHLSLIGEESTKTQTKCSKLKVSHSKVNDKTNLNECKTYNHLGLKEFENDKFYSSIDNCCYKILPENDRGHYLNAQTNDELFLLIKNDDTTNNSNNNNNYYMEYRQYVINKKINDANEKLRNSYENSVIKVDDDDSKIMPQKYNTPKRKSRSRSNYKKLRNNSLNKRLSMNMEIVKHKQLFINSEIYMELAHRILKLNKLLSFEEKLLLKLSNNCANYRAENQLYISSGIKMDNIEETQIYLNEFANAIVHDELDLYNLKQEITKQCGILYNLKRMIKMEGHDNIEEMILCTAQKYLINEFNAYEKFEKTNKNDSYEIFDNNKSMIV